MRIYLDNCCFNRPYDDQNQMKVYFETEAKLYIQEQIKLGKFQLVWSYILDFENYQNQDMNKRELISDWINFSVEDIEENEDIIKSSNELKKIGFDFYDSLHLACAIYAKCEYFMTTDNKILKKRDQINSIKVINPIDFIRELEE
jgi:predicted nucleic acid-binding protein